MDRDKHVALDSPGGYREFTNDRDGLNSSKCNG